MKLLRFLKPVDFFASLLNFLVCILAVALLVTHPKLPPLVPLWFSKTWGESRLALPSYLWLIPIFIVGFFLISNFCARLLNGKYWILARILVWTATFISFVFLFALYKIILLVT